MSALTRDTWCVTSWCCFDCSHFEVLKLPPQLEPHKIKQVLPRNSVFIYSPMNFNRQLSRKHSITEYGRCVIVLVRYVVMVSVCWMIYINELFDKKPLYSLYPVCSIRTH